ncbi:energy transducer TonB [Emcibacter sp. SYSU 3D8]|uniref:energy transducer TonB n=1 Tax=Emcibacter sp. SYSU 3D8 TaxID=3133969 RepID=UPI0031FECF6C
MRWTERVALAAVAGIFSMAWTAAPVAAAPETPPSTSEMAAASASRTDPRQDPANPVTQPAYPSDAFQKGEVGNVVLKFVVRPDGSVDPASVAVAESSGSPSLDKAAVAEASTSWRFIPATENGKPVAATHMFRVVFAIDDAPDQAKGAYIVAKPGLVDVQKKFVADARTGVTKEDKRAYQEGRADGVYYRFYDDGSGTFQTSAPGTDSVGAWNLLCGMAGSDTLCVARYYKLETMLVKDKGWLVSLIGQRMTVCPIAFLPKDKTQEPTAMNVTDPTGPAVFPDKDGTSIVKGLMEMESFVAPCGQEVIADPNMAMTPAPFPVIRRYMEWVLAGQPAG